MNLPVDDFQCSVSFHLTNVARLEPTPAVHVVKVLFGLVFHQVVPDQSIIGQPPHYYFLTKNRFLLPICDKGSPDDNLSPGPGLVGHFVIALFPVDQLDMGALVGRAHFPRAGDLRHFHGSGAGARLRQSVSWNSKVSFTCVS